MSVKARPIAIEGLQPGQVIGHVERGRAAQSSGDIQNVLGRIENAQREFNASMEAKAEEQQEEIDTLNSHVKELNNKIEAGNRAARGGDGLGYMGSDSGANNKARKDLGDFARGMRASMTTESNPDGGFLLIPDYDRSIRQLSSQTSALRRAADVVSITSDTYIRTVNLQGTAAGWVSETGGRPETAGFKLAELQLVAHEMYAMPSVTQKLLEDAYVDVGAEIESQIAKKFGAMEADAFINGDGVGKPYGIVNPVYAKVADASWAWGKLGFIKSGDASGFIAPTSSALPADAIIDLVYALKPEYKADATFIMNTSTAAAVRKFKDSEGRYLWNDSIVSGQPPTLLGYPVLLDEAMPNVGAGTFPIAFGDFKQGYVVVDRLGTRLVRDNLTQKPYVLFYTTRRVGGGIVNYEAIKLLKISA